MTMQPYAIPAHTLQPVQIGPMTIDPPLFLAPMAGQTTYAFRTLAREAGDVGLVCTELISSSALCHKSTYKQTLDMLDWQPEVESPFAVQLFGSDPALMAEAAQFVVERGANIVDVNMGCWVPKVAKQGGAGAALLRDVCTAETVVRAVVDAVDVPVTVKIRSGWEESNPTAVSFARAAEAAGVQAIAIHARFAHQGHGGSADWSWIRRVQEAVSIPVIGNGDVTNGPDATRMLEATGADGVMIGRAAMGNPWIFREVAAYLRGDPPPPPPSPEQIADTAVEQARCTMAHTPYSELKTARELRGQLLKYAERLPQAEAVRAGIIKAETLDAIEAAFAPAYAAR